MAAPMMTSVGGLLTLLKEDEQRELQEYAVQTLLEVVDSFWSEISDSLSDLEILFEDTKFTQRQRASLLLSKVYYHLGEFEDAVSFALKAKQCFDPGNHDHYTTAIVRKCIDAYSKLQQMGQEERQALGKDANERHAELTTLFERLVASWRAQDPDFTDVREHAGLILEARRLDLLEGLLHEYVSKTRLADMMSHVLVLANSHIEEVQYKEEALRMVVRLYKGQQDDKLRAVNYFEMQHCLIFLKDFKQIVSIMCMLLDDAGNSLSELTAYQLAFDLFEHCDQGFVNSVMEGIRGHLAEKAAAAAPAPAAAEQPQQGGQSDVPVEEQIAKLEADKEKAFQDNDFDQCEKLQEQIDKLQKAGGGEAAAEGGAAAAPAGPTVEKSAVPQPYQRIFTILIGAVTADLSLQFLTSQSKADIEVMNKIKKAIESKNSVTHGAAVIANSLLYCGTTQSAFLHQNLEWLGKAQLWAQFSATASIGVINKGHVTKSMQMFEKYLPPSPAASGGHPYQEGGALYGLGLIHAPIGCNLSEDAAELAVVGNSGEKTTRPREVLNYLIQCLQSAGQEREQIAHGATLGIGLSSMASRDENLYELLKQTMYQDNAVGGESAALAIGLVFLGSADQQKAHELLQYVKDTNHEKIIRGVGLAVSLLSYGREAHADILVDEMLNSKEPWLRLGGVQVIGMAYAGTGNRAALERLLTCSVQDTSDDVRRGAITNIGFVAFKDPALVANLTSLHCDSFHPHVRCGSAVALGISGAGTGNKVALDRLWKLKDDSSPFVAQAAIISLAMVLMQKTEKEIPRVKEFRELLVTKMGDRYTDQMVKYGAIMAMGIIDCGGRNQLIALHKSGHNLIKPIVGMHLFTQFWYWFPYTLMLSLAFQPTCLIALNKELRMPKYKFKSNAAPSQFGVPKKGSGKHGEEHKKREKVVLSTTLKTQKRQQKKKGDAMDVDDKKEGDEKKEGEKKDGEGKKDKDGDTQMKDGEGAAAAAGATEGEKKDGEKKDDDKKDEKEEPEPGFEILQNPARVTLGQLDVLSFDEDERYHPVKAGRLFGVVMVSDQKPGEAEELVEALGIEDAEDDEPPPPEPFEWP
eukprot:TRINITY_DN1724_c0_g1_i3.p1 TRINITY_DN1724_c0_g1~~TRINITY_DN1724_c0_g1_i3.p1  ORF type:complete len:1120 (+),score=514.38 TRINITY_DN1724_c0_g1_i3:98-3361(+)